MPGFNGIKNDVLYIHTTFEDNINNLDEAFLAEADRVKKFDIRKFSNLFLGEWMSAEANALFNQKHLDLARTSWEGERGYTVVAIDPAVTANKDSDETAIVKAYKSGQHFVIEEVIHGIWTPNEWARKAIDLAEDANELIYESNQGGLLVENALKNAGCTKKISSVHASKGKILSGCQLFPI